MTTINLIPDDKTTRRLLLRTVKEASKEIGCSAQWFRDLMTDGFLTCYVVRGRTFVSVAEFESIAQPRTRKATV